MPWHTGYRRWLSALEGMVLTLPLSLGCVLLVFSHAFPQHHLPSGILATLLGLALVHALATTSRRPMIFSARLFEAAALAAMLLEASRQFPGWHLPDTPGTRLAYLCALAAGAALVNGLLMMLRADALTRYIPAPVFRGFANSIAILLLMSQFHNLSGLLDRSQPLWLVTTVTLAAAGASFAVRYLQPRWPSAAIGLSAGTAIALVLAWQGHASVALIETDASLRLPWMDADFLAYTRAGTPISSIATQWTVHALLLGVMAFINSTVAEQTISQSDGRPPATRTQRMLQWLGLIGAGLMGSLVITSSQFSTQGASRQHPVTGSTVMIAAVLIVVVALSGVIAWLPVAAVCGVMLMESWFFVDRGSVQSLLRWFRRRPMSTNDREDLALIALVTVTAVALNMVAAVFIGFLLGLLSFAARNARRPVRAVHNCAQLRSNCSRPRIDMALLDRHAHKIKVFELEGDLFFGSATSVERDLRQHLADARFAILDWTAVSHLDSSLARTIEKVEHDARTEGKPIWHAGLAGMGDPVAETLLEHLPDAHLLPDLDHALELAENALIASVMSEAEEVALLPQLPNPLLFQGLDPQSRQVVESLMITTHHRAGEQIFAAGAPSDELILVRQGSASIEITKPGGEILRLATVLSGATLGEIGFLDRAPRSASVTAREDLVLQRLSRDSFDRLSLSHPPIIQQMLSNIASELASRLRSTNALLMARHRKSQRSHTP